LPACERSPLGDLALERARWSVAFLDEYADRYLPDHPWPHLEYFCGICVDRLGWTGSVGNTNGWPSWTTTTRTAYR
jgi:hypothetical protein